MQIAILKQVVQVCTKSHKLLSLDPNQLLQTFCLASGAEAGLIWLTEGNKPVLHLQYSHVKPISSNKESHKYIAPEPTSSRVLQGSILVGKQEKVPDMVSARCL